MVTPELLEARRAQLASGDLATLLARQLQRARPLLEAMPPVPNVKATLTSAGGVCPSCRGALGFDPWSPDRHRCASCGAETDDPRQHGHWARAQHLWIAERAAQLAMVGVLGDDRACADRARELLAAYHRRYFELPNRDNVLGPSHPFFSTYLESMWVLNVLAAASALRARGWLPDEEIDATSAIADEAANLIGEFNEGLSNRQTWNAAALTAIAVWFGDGELARMAIEGQTGLLGHLTEGFADDGMWYEGENYHLFAIRGLLVGLDWAKAMGVDLLANDELAAHLGDALMAPTISALPDLTFPARRDSRFGVSLAHPAFLECWEVGLASLGEAAPDQLVPWLWSLYAAPHRPAATYDAYLHDAGAPERSRTTRADLSWWMLLAMMPELPPDTLPRHQVSARLPSQGLAVLRRAARYLSLECGGSPGGHGHPDQLHLTLHDQGVHWLADPGAGSYVTDDLHWYRSTLAHNAPRLDQQSQRGGNGACRAFDPDGEVAWVQGRWGRVTRSIVETSDWMLDVVDLAAGPETTLELPWHLEGQLVVGGEGSWVPDTLPDRQLSAVERWQPTAPGPIRIESTVGEASLRLLMLGGELWCAECPGRPGAPRRKMLLVAARDSSRRFATVLSPGGLVTGLRLEGDGVVLTAAEADTVIQFGAQSATVSSPNGSWSLGGAVEAPAEPPRPIVTTERQDKMVAAALRIDHRPALDGTLDGFDPSAPIELADELCYRRSEEPYGGPDSFAATVYLNWDERNLYLAAEVAKPEVALRAPEAEPLELDNDPDDIHADGLQVYYRMPGSDLTGYLIRPSDDGGVWARPIPGDPRSLASLEAGSAIDENGYLLTVALPCAGLERLPPESKVEFEVIVNEMRGDRVRRAGQLVWGGRGGWVYLRGDRVDPSELGLLELVE